MTLKKEGNKKQSIIKTIMKNEKVKTWWIYSIIFSSLILFLLLIFYKLKKGLIWQSDALKQHFVILKSFNEIIRNFLSNPGIGLPQIAFEIGLGEDIIGQLSYYIIGDPFAYISLLFPMKHLELAYTFLIILRMYCVGLSFLIFGFYKKLKPINNLVGALIYTFSGFILFAGVRHPYFLNPAILFPLLLIAIDILFKKDKIALLTILTFISLLSNYYFFYMLTALIGIYILVKFFTETKEKNWRNLLHIILKTIEAYIIAILMASVIFLPTLYAFCNSSRIDVSNFNHYHFNYYIKLFNGLISTEVYYWNIYGVSSIILLVLPLFLRNRKNYKTLFIYTIVIIVLLMFPHLGSMMNGFSYPSNRFIFAFSFLLAYQVALLFDFNANYSKTEIKLMALSLVGYFSIYTTINFKIQITSEIVIAIMLASLILITILFQKELKKYKIPPKTVIVVLVIINLASQIYFLYSTEGNHQYAKEFVKYKKVDTIYNTMNNKITHYKEAINEIKKDTSFYRISNETIELPNMSLYQNTKGINSFYSVGSKYEAMLAKELNNFDYQISKYIGEFDNRTRIKSLLGVKYYITSTRNKKETPYGYELQKEMKDTKIYQNKNYIPLGAFYTSYITEDNYQKLSPLDKEESLLQNVTIKEPIHGYNLKETITVSNVKNISYHIEDKNKIQSQNQINVKNKNHHITLNFNASQKNKEYYLVIKNLKYKKYNKKEYQKLFPKSKSIANKKYQNTNSYTIKVSHENMKKQKKILLKDTSPYAVEYDELLIHLESLKQGKNEIKISFDNLGKYTYSRIEIQEVDLDKSQASISKLKEQSANLKQKGYNEITGTITAKEDGVLLLQTLYQKGWTAYVDNKKTTPMNANTAFIGIPIKKGSHHIHFKYETPYLKTGITLSLIGIVSYIIVLKKEKLQQ